MVWHSTSTFNIEISISIFKKIENGDISNFGKRLLYEINNYKKNWIVKTKKNRLKLENQYSAEKEKKLAVSLVTKATPQDAKRREGVLAAY